MAEREHVGPGGGAGAGGDGDGDHQQAALASDAGSGGGDGGHGEVTVRLATRADMPHIHRMIHELATYEGVPDGPRLSVDDLIEDGFSASPAWFFTLVAERRGRAGAEPVGYALCNRAYSSWTRRAFYVEDLYVRRDLRRAGLGTMLLRHLCQMAVVEGVSRVDWHVLEQNETARAFYARLGARDLRLSEGRAALRLDLPHIRRLAAADTAATAAAGPPPRV